jgi:enoyl-CoA hydratase/carnithine racemase
VIGLEKQGNVFVLRMQNGENRYNPDSIDELNGALDKVEAAADPAALVTIGESKFYSNGLDLEWMSQAGAKGAFDNIGRVHALLGRMLGFPCITIAAINGHAFAAGAMFALAHDFRVMRNDRGFFCLPEVDIGMTFTDSMESVIKSRLSKATAHEAMTTGRRYTSSEALAASIVQASVAEADVLPTALALAEKHAKKDRKTLAGIKRSLYKETLAIIARESAPK